jgi:DNA-binding ferritin-like protein (Dps family)
MTGSLMEKALGDEKEWRSMEARADAPPRDHRVVHAAMKRHLWRSTFGDGTAAMVVPPRSSS